MQTSQKGQFFFVLTLLPRLFAFRNWRIFGSCVFCAPLDRYIGRHLGRHIGRHSTDVLIDISAECRLICQSTYRSSVGRYVDWYVGQGVHKIHMIRIFNCRPGKEGVLPDKRLMGICRWMGPHFHNWIDYHGVAFSIQLLERCRTFSKFWG